jgi:hypothetical protein
MSKIDNTAPPYAAIEKLVNHVLMNEHTVDHWQACEIAKGPILNKDHIVNPANEVLEWLDANLMTTRSQDLLDQLEGRGASPQRGPSSRDPRWPACKPQKPGLEK